MDYPVLNINQGKIWTISSSVYIGLRISTIYFWGISQYIHFEYYLIGFEIC